MPSGNLPLGITFIVYTAEYVQQHPDDRAIAPTL